jgi:hypothetical protein
MTGLDPAIFNSAITFHSQHGPDVSLLRAACRADGLNAGGHPRHMCQQP